MSDAIAIIPARGGSKRIPRKNIKDFLGKPIIAYSIETALKSGLFDEVMVSTDDEEIAEIAKRYGARVPFMRSLKNADDFAGTSDVINEVLLEYKNIGIEFDFFCCIYPTAPFITSKKLRESYVKLKKNKFDSVFPVVKFNYPIQRALKIIKDKVSMIEPKNLNKRSQDLMPIYHDAGQFYFMKTESFLIKNKLFTENTGAIELSELEVQDIDTKIDWEIAEIKYQLNKR